MATSPEHLLQMIEKLFYDNGIKITFENYPSSYSDCCSNSHRSPKDYKQNWCHKHKDLPRGYPGFYGRWEGKIEVINFFNKTAF